MNLYSYHSTPKDLKYYDSGVDDKIPVLAWAKYAKIGKIPEHKELFAKDAEYSYEYAKAFDARFKEGEDAIATSAKYSYYYANEILNWMHAPLTRFTKGEPAIAKDAEFSYYYARQVLKGPFPEGEETMKNNPKIWDAYKKTMADYGKEIK